MYSYIIGKVTEVMSNAIILENNGIGYLINTPNPFAFLEGSDYKVYLYQQIKEDEHNLFGFKTKEEKELFLKLIGVKGLGPKMALPIIATGSINGISDAINRENILYLKKFPKIGEKLAKQMILDLKGNLDDLSSGEGVVKDTSEELREALLGLGYKDKEIKSIILKVDNSLSIEDQIKEALKLLLK